MHASAAKASGSLFLRMLDDMHKITPEQFTFGSAMKRSQMDVDGIVLLPIRDAKLGPNGREGCFGRCRDDD